MMPLETFEQAAGWINAYRHKDGFVYPHVERTGHGSVRPGASGSSLEDFDWEPEPHTERPALLHKLPASHEIVLHQAPLEGDLRANDGGFLMQLASYLFGVRLQFCDWWFDGRVPVVSTHNISPHPKSIREFFSHSLEEWRGWSEGARRLFTNVLYMNSRSPSYEWDWERFTINYMVFDALYRLANELHTVKAPDHPSRMQKMCDFFGLWVDEDRMKEIYRLRNELFHEALWDGSQPGTTTGVRAFAAEGNLRRMNQRLVVALLGYKTDYIRSSWLSISTFGF